MKLSLKLYKRILLFLIGTAVFAPSAINAQELAVGSTIASHKSIPFNATDGNRFYQKSETIYPASSLNNLNGKVITGIKYLANKAQEVTWGGEFIVFLKEVNITNFANTTSFSGMDDAVIVYKGSDLKLESSKEMIITFTQPYYYNGGNLLIGVYKTPTTEFTVNFMGSDEAKSASLYGTSATSLEAITSGTKLSFMPKTTFIYTEAQSAMGPVIQVNGFENGGEFIFADGTPVPEDTEQTFTIKNNGDEDLTIQSVSVSGEFKLSSVSLPSILQPKETLDVTVKTPAKDTEGQLIITSDDETNSSFVINLKSKYKVPAPVMVIDLPSIEMGKVTTDKEVSFNIKNEGDAALVVSLTSSNPEFTVSPANLNIAPGNLSQVTVNFLYNENYYGKHSADIVITPEGNLDAVTIPVFAIIQDPYMWTEDFEGNALPEGWEAGTQWKFEDGVAIATYKYNANDYLTTPTLIVKDGDELSFQYKPTASFFDIYVYGSKDGGEYSEVAHINSGSTASFSTYTLKSLAPGKWRFRFLSEDYQLDNFEGCKLDANAPVMELSSKDNAEFGKVTAVPDPILYSVVNTGTGLLNVKISSDNEDFTVEPSELSDIPHGESASFAVKFNYNISNLGEKSAVITVIPTYNPQAAVSFNATAIAKDPNIWEEDFEACEDGNVPSNWSTDGWKVTQPATYSGGNGTYMAYAGTSGNHYLTTPRLYAEQGQVLNFEVGGDIDTTDVMVIEYSNDGNEWIALEASPVTQIGEMKFTAPEANYYYLRFSGKYGAVDNFVGFRLAPKAHEVSIASSNLPTTADQYVEYVTTVSLEEKTLQEENVEVRLLINGQCEDSRELVLNAGEAKNITLSYVPETTESFTSKIVVVYDSGNETAYTQTVNVIVTAAPRLSDAEELEIPQGRKDVVEIEYTSEPGWTTISMPFALTEEILEQIFGEDYKIFEVTSYSNGVITFKNPTVLAAGFPYLVYAPEGSVNEKVVVEDVNLLWSNGLSDSHNGVTFQATFKPLKAGEMTGLFVAEGKIPNTVKFSNEVIEAPSLKWCDENKTMKGFRGYFILDDTVTDVPELLIIDKDGQFSTIDNLNGEESESPEGIYNLQGVKLNKASKPGIYIINGKKVIVK